jgi:hypothetical protein
MIERLHRYIKERLALIAYERALNFVDGTDDWTRFLPLIQSIYNNTPNSITEVAPNSVIYGRTFLRPAPVPEAIEDYDAEFTLPDDYVVWMEQRRHIFREQLMERQRRNQAIQQNYQNRKNRDAHKGRFKPGDLVLWDIKDQLINKADLKLQPTWIGPFEVITVNDDAKVVTLNDPQKNKVHLVNESKLKLTDDREVNFHELVHYELNTMNTPVDNWRHYLCTIGNNDL